MKLDLERFHMRTLTFQCTQMDDDGLFARLADLATDTQRQREDRIAFVDFYRRSGVRHAAAFTVHRHGAPAATDSHLQIAFVYFVLPADEDQRTAFRHSEKPKATISHLIELLSRTDGTHRFDCTADFTYPLKGAAPLVSLPVKLSTWPESPFDEIAGIRFVKRLGDDIQYTAILDLGDQDLHLGLRYEWEQSYLPDLPKSVLSRAIEISRRFVRP